MRSLKSWGGKPDVERRRSGVDAAATGRQIAGVPSGSVKRSVNQVDVLPGLDDGTAYRRLG